MNLKNKLKPVTAATVLQAAGVVFAVCYYDTTKTCAYTNDLVREDWNVAGQCYDYWYATVGWVSPDTVPWDSGPLTYNNYVYGGACSGPAKKFDCILGAFVGSPQQITANRPNFDYYQVDYSGPCF